MHKTITYYILAVLLFLAPCVASTDSGPGADPLEAMIEELLQNSPELRASEKKIEVYQERPAQARSLDDPMLGIGIMNVPVDSFDLDQEEMTQKQVTVRQKFPFPGKRSLKGSIAERELETVSQEYTAKKNSLIMMVKTAYYDLLFVNKAMDIAQRNRDLLRELTRAAETEYTVGRGIQADLLKAHLEQTGIMKQIISLRQQKETYQARLNSLLNRPVQTPVTVGEIRQSTFHLGYEELVRIADVSNPALLGLGYMIEKSRLAVSLASKEYYPDFDIGVSYGQREDRDGMDRPDFISASVMMNIPLWYRDKESRKVSEEESNARMIQERYNAMRNDIHYQIKQLLSETERYSDEIDLMRTGFIPQSRLALESAMAGYRTNKTGFLATVKNRIELYNYELEYYRSITLREKKLAELEAVVGRSLY